MDRLTADEREQMHRVVGMLEAEGLDAASLRMRVYVRELASECLKLVRESETPLPDVPALPPGELRQLHPALQVAQPTAP